jgi:hypothetical protein
MLISSLVLNVPMTRESSLYACPLLADRVNLSRNVDLAPDGKRVVALMPVQTF